MNWYKFGAISSMSGGPESLEPDTWSGERVQKRRGCPRLLIQHVMAYLFTL